MTTSIESEVVAEPVALPRSAASGLATRTWRLRPIFPWLDERGLALPLGRAARAITHNPIGGLRMLAHEAFANPIGGRSVVLFALPKSGSTMSELAFRTMGLVDLQHSLWARTCSADWNSPAPEQLSRIFRFVSPRRQGFAKTHIAWHPTIRAAMMDLGIVGAVQIRDIRDVLVSRYHHVMSDPSHRHHAMLRDLSPSEGLRRSFFGERPLQGDDPLPYLAQWVVSWTAAAELPVLRYEDYLTNDCEFLRSLRSLAGRDEVDTELLQRAIRNDRERAAKAKLATRLRNRALNFSTFRQGERGGWRQIFDQEAIDLVKRHANHALLASGYESDDRW